MPYITYPHYAGAIIHAMNRGVAGRPIFLDDAAKQVFSGTVLKAKRRFRFELLGFCMMTNHYHLLIRVQDVPIDVIIQWIQTVFAKYYNKRFGTEGHVFYRRFGRVPCETNEQLATVLKYIHENPVRAGLVGRADEWPWSSHRAYLGGADDLTDTALCLSLFGEGEQAVRRYAAWMDTPLVLNWPHKRRSRWKDILERPATPRPALPRQDAQNVAESVCSGLGVTFADLRSSSISRKVAKARRTVAKELIARGYSQADAARLMLKSRMAVCKMLKAE